MVQPSAQDVAKAMIIPRPHRDPRDPHGSDDTPAPSRRLPWRALPAGTEIYNDRDGRPILVKKQVVLTGDRLTDASSPADGQRLKHPSRRRR